MSDKHQQIFQLRLIFMKELQSVCGKIDDKTYCSLEGTFKDLTRLADELADQAIAEKAASEGKARLPIFPNPRAKKRGSSRNWRALPVKVKT